MKSLESTQSHLRANLRAMILLAAGVLLCFGTQATAIAAQSQSPAVHKHTGAAQREGYHPTPQGRAAEARGLAAAKRGDFQQARTEFLAVFESDPYFPDNLYYLALASSKLPGLELSAAAWFEAYLAIEPSSPRAAEIRTTIDSLVQAGRDHAALLVGALERMAEQFPEQSLDARKAHDVLLADELALLGPAHPKGGDYEMADNGVWPAPAGDPSRAWAAGNWLAQTGTDKSELSHVYARWGRLDLAAQILGKEEHSGDFKSFDYLPEIIHGRFLNEITARSIFRPGDFLTGAHLSLSDLCKGAVAFASRQFVYDRREAMYTLNPCFRGASQDPEEARTLDVSFALADILWFVLEDQNLKAAYQIYKTQDFRLPLAECMGMYYQAASDKQDGKPGASKSLEDARVCLARSRALPPVAAAAAAAFAGDAYEQEKALEEQRGWPRANNPENMVEELAEGRPSPLKFPHEAVDEWVAGAGEPLSGGWFVNYQSQLQSLRSYTPPAFIVDKAGDVFYSTADAARTLIEGFLLVTTMQRTIVVYHPPTVPPKPTWEK